MARKDLKEYSWDEISTHNTESSCWIVLHNKVFDITPFMTKVTICGILVLASVQTSGLQWRILECYATCSWKQSVMHPGGNKVLLNTAGKDGTEGFERAFHSPKARAMLQGYLIGRLPASESASLMVMPGMGRNFRQTGYPRLQ